MTSATQDLTSDVGRLVGTVEEVRLNPFINFRKKFFRCFGHRKRLKTIETQVLGSKREDVVKLADRVEDNVSIRN